MEVKEKKYLNEKTPEELEILAKKYTVERYELPDQNDENRIYVGYRLYTGKASEDQITAWKKEHNLELIPVVELIVDKEHRSLVYYRPPNRIHMARAMGYIQDKQVIEAGESLLDDCWLGGDPRCKSIDDKDAKYRVSAANLVYHATTIFAGEIKNV